MPDFPISWVRQSFPVLNAKDDFVFFDNGAGAKCPKTFWVDGLQYTIPTFLPLLVIMALIYMARRQP